MDYQALAELLFPHVTATPEELEARFPQRNLPEGAVVTRMAPSPTGFVHLGNLVQGMISERMAHRTKGVLFLRAVAPHPGPQMKQQTSNRYAFISHIQPPSNIMWGNCNNQAATETAASESASCEQDAKLNLRLHPNMKCLFVFET